jgi:prepilin-type N-terminal cleavage/methylation domain-containing protein
MPRKFQRGFTLVELLASMVLFSMIIGLTAWAVIGATDTTSGAEKRMDTASQARAFFDRFGADLNTMMDEGGLTALYYGDTSNAAGNSAIGFVCRSRPRVASADSRGVVVGYRINDTTDLSGSYPMISRGDAELRYSFDPSMPSMKSILENASNDLEDGSSDLFQLGVQPTWQVLGTGIIRFHISFLLNTGRIVQTPPDYKTTDNIFPEGVDTGSCKFIPFRAEDSNEIDPEDPDRRRRLYVVGLVASIAVLDTRTRDQAFKSDITSIVKFPGKFERPAAGSDKTALSVWNDKLLTADISKPVRANIRFYERMYTVR